jgi:hypothetical protein
VQQTRHVKAEPNPCNYVMREWFINAAPSVSDLGAGALAGSDA